jgi:hypothetical protein
MRWQTTSTLTGGANTLSARRGQKFNVNILRKVEFEGQLPLTPLIKLICAEIGCKRSRAYELVHEGEKAKIFRYDKHLETYAKT